MDHFGGSVGDQGGFHELRAHDPHHVEVGDRFLEAVAVRLLAGLEDGVAVGREALFRGDPAGFGADGFVEISRLGCGWRSDGAGFGFAFDRRGLPLAFQQRLVGFELSGLLVEGGVLLVGDLGEVSDAALELGNRGFGLLRLFRGGLAFAFGRWVAFCGLGRRFGCRRLSDGDFGFGSGRDGFGLVRGFGHSGLLGVPVRSRRELHGQRAGMGSSGRATRATFP